MENYQANTLVWSYSFVEIDHEIFSMAASHGIYDRVDPTVVRVQMILGEQLGRKNQPASHGIYDRRLHSGESSNDIRWTNKQKN